MYNAAGSVNGRIAILRNRGTVGEPETGQVIGTGNKTHNDAAIGKGDVPNVVLEDPDLAPA